MSYTVYQVVEEFNTSTGVVEQTLRIYHEADSLQEAQDVAERSSFEKAKIHKDY